MGSTTYPVGIVGGGPTGLLASILLSRYDIPHILFERYPSTSVHPKATGLNQRTIEVFRQIGLEKEIIKNRAPGAIVGQSAWYTSLGPNAKEIVRRDAWGGGVYQSEYEDVSPCSFSMLPQIRLEPILQRKAFELNPDTIFYSTEVTGVEQGSDDVVITYQRKNQAPETTRVQYCICADGGRRFTEELDFGWDGEKDIIDMVSAHIRAPLSQYHPDTRNYITWFINPKLGGTVGSGALYHLGPYPMSTETEEWVFNCAINPQTDPKKFEQSVMVDRIQQTLQIPDLKVEILSISHWFVNGIAAKQYRSEASRGRIFLIGDAAHRLPPWGALGLNTGVQDTSNLIWKLNLAINGLPPHIPGKQNWNALLATYDSERRPVGQRVRDTALYNFRAHGLIMDVALGQSPQNSEAENTAALDEFFDLKNTQEGQSRRDAVKRAQVALSGEFHGLGADTGWFYPELDIEDEGRATNHDGQLDKDGEFDTLRYHPSTIPGHHLPHIWVERSGKIVSTRDLVRYDGFILVTSDPRVWQEAVAETQGLVSMIGISDEESQKQTDTAWRDVQTKWPSLSGVSSTGAVLVRPDGIVIWRAKKFDGSQYTGKQWLKDVILRSLQLAS